MAECQAVAAAQIEKDANEAAEGAEALPGDGGDGIQEKLHLGAVVFGGVGERADGNAHRMAQAANALDGGNGVPQGIHVV